MTPKASQEGRATGTSFKGVFAYLQHDKRLEGQDVNSTSDRVEWQEFRNLATENPDMAYRIMRATANQQDALKREAGQSLAGNKSDKVVFHYSLAWHPDEKDDMTKTEMMKAADESIKALGADGHQAAIIAHNDTKHPHLHVVINRVNPEHGKMLDLWKYQERLSKWALGYEQSRGTIYCEQREMNWKRRDLGETFSADKCEVYHKHDQAKGLGHANDNEIRKIMAAQKAKDAALAENGAAMHERHSEEWKDLSKWYATGKAKIAGTSAGDTPTPFQKARAQIKEQYRTAWREHYAKQRTETKYFEKREQRLLGKLENAVSAVKMNKELAATDKGHAQSSLFNFLTSSKARADALEQLHAAQTRKL
ncbi:relaxase/mobilization nuclease domain-containing protein, partial [Ascidiaceihabitans sp.]|uniref:relaxase/mobilization nuclease domain-containing protein n=2 Tax=Ascidiaceihabitans sp. TaxID=1872644 RepID=UPI0032970F90